MNQTSRWKLFDSGAKSAEDNMRLDEKLLEELDPKGPAILHLYEWKKPSLTYGYFVSPKDYLNVEALSYLGIDLAKRPTGGGIIFHVTDLAFSAFVPAFHEGFSENTLDNYVYINQKVLQAIQGIIKEHALELLPQDPRALDESSSRFCMAKPTIYDVMIAGKKIAGAAQRKRKAGFLHQGSISIAFPKEDLLQTALLPETKVLEGMRQSTYTLLPQDATNEEIASMRQELRHQLMRTFIYSE